MIKKVMICMLALAGCITATSQKVVKFVVDYEEIENKRGELYQYSERYLGTKDVIREDSKEYVLKNISVKDNDNDNNGQQNKGKKQAIQRHDNNRNEYTHLLPPLNEDVLLAANNAKKAEGVAKMIYRLREARINIASGEAEHAPSDGTSMRLSLNELKDMENELTEMFTGSTKVKKGRKEVRYETGADMEETTEVVVMRFSKFAGVVDVDDLSGDPVYMKIMRKIGPKETDDKKKKKEQPQMEVKETRIVVEYNGQKLLSHTL